MDADLFANMLSRYKVVRSRDAELPRPRRPSSQRRAPSSLKDGAAAARVAAAGAPLPVEDFWGGLAGYLEKVYGAAGAKAVQAAFEELHYSSVRALNYEDVEDLAAVMAAEVGLPSAAAVQAAAAAAGPAAELD